jgi:hypothetical protein
MEVVGVEPGKSMQVIRFASILGIGQGSCGLRRVSPLTNFNDTSVPISFEKSCLYFGAISMVITRTN